MRPAGGGAMRDPYHPVMAKAEETEAEDLRTPHPTDPGDDCPFEGPGGSRPCQTGVGCAYLEECPLRDPLQEADL
jgi:hypothetical protein